MSNRVGRLVFAVAALSMVGGCVSIAPGAGSAPPATSANPVTGTSAVDTPGSVVPTPQSVSATATATASAAGQPSLSAVATGTATLPNGSGSIAYVKAGDIWLAAPDGSGAHQLTTDGSQTGYHDPTQSPDGTVLALRGPGTVVALDRSTGAQVRAPVTLPTLENGAEGLVVSPDGTHIAYTTTGFGKTVDPRFGTPNGAFIYGGTDVATLDGNSVPNAAIAAAIFPEWADASTLVVSDGTKLYLDEIGGQPNSWLDLSNGCLTDVGCPADQGPAANLTDPALSADDHLVAAVYKPYYGDGGRLVGTLDAPLPSDPATTCMLPGQGNFSDPGSFAPDDSSFAYDDTSFDPTTLESTVGQGIYVLKLSPSASDCGASNAVLVIPGGAQPSWGPMAP